MTDIDTRPLRALLAASTPGPWATAPHDATTVMPKPWADSAVPPHPATTAPFGMIQFTGPRNEADATLVAEALTALPALLDEVDRLDGEVDSWVHMYLEAVHDFRAACLDIAKHVEESGTLAEVVDLVSEHMYERAGGELTEETIALLLRAQNAANGDANPRAEER